MRSFKNNIGKGYTVILKKSKNSRGSYLDLELFIFVLKFEYYLVTQYLYGNVKYANNWKVCPSLEGSRSCLSEACPPLKGSLACLT